MTAAFAERLSPRKQINPAISEMRCAAMLRQQRLLKSWFIFVLKLDGMHRRGVLSCNARFKLLFIINFVLSMKYAVYF